jgi:hypothetical protein
MIQCPSNRCLRPTGPFSHRGTLPVAGQWFDLWWCDSDKLFFIAPEDQDKDPVVHPRFRGFPEQHLNWVAAGPGMTRWGLGGYIIELTHSWRDVEITVFWIDNRGNKQRVSLEWTAYNASPDELIGLFASRPDLKAAAPQLAQALAFLLTQPQNANRLQARRL